MTWLAWYIAFTFLLAGMAWWPCCRGAGCAIGADDFGRASLGGSWVADAGSWSIASGVLQTTSSSGRLEYQTSHPGSVASAIVNVQVKGTADGDCLRIWLTTDLFVELELETDGFGYLRLYDNSGEIAETRVEGATLDTWHSLTGCYHHGDGKMSERFSGHFIPSETGFTTQVYTQERYVIDGGTGNHVGLATGTLTGTASFDMFDFKSHQGDGDYTSCEDCLECEIWTPWSPSIGTGDATDAWDQISGTWTNAPGEPLKTDSASAVVVSRVTHSSDSCDSRLTCTIDSADNNTVKVYLPYGTGDSDSVYVSIKFHATLGKVKLYDGATLLQESGFYNTSGPQDVTFCIRSGRASIKVGSAIDAVDLDLLTQTTGRVFGFASANASAGTTISDLIWERTKSDQAECVACGGYEECQFCIADNQPEFMVVTADGVQDGTFCDSCEEMNGTYVQRLYGSYIPCWYWSTAWIGTCTPPLPAIFGYVRFIIGSWYGKTGVTDPYIMDDAYSFAPGTLKATRPYYPSSSDVGLRITLTAVAYTTIPYTAIVADSAGHYKWSSGEEDDIDCTEPKSLGFVGQCDDYFSGSPRQVCDFASSTLDIMPW